MTDLSKWVGSKQSVSDTVTQSGVERFCATVGSEKTSSGDPKVNDPLSTNKVAPLGYHWCLCLADTALADLDNDGHPKKGGFLPPVAFPRRMWASANTEFIADLPIGSTVTRQSEVIAINEKTGKSGSLVFVEVDHQILLEGECAIKEQQTIVYKEASTEPMPLPSIDNGKPTGWQFVEEFTPSTPMLFRYSSLTFNSHRIHYDLNYAKDEEMYPELVVHGPLQATLALQLAATQGTVKTFSFRGVAPAFCNQPLYLCANFEADKGELATIGANGERRLVAKVGFQ